MSYEYEAHHHGRTRHRAASPAQAAVAQAPAPIRPSAAAIDSDDPFGVDDDEEDLFAAPGRIAAPVAERKKVVRAPAPELAGAA